MSNSSSKKIEKGNSVASQGYDNDFEEYKSLSTHDQLESDSTVPERNIHLDGIIGDESIIKSKCNPAEFESENVDSQKCSVYSDSSSSELANSLQCSNSMQQSQDKNKSYWWDSLDCPTNQGSNNICPEPNKRYKFLKNDEASDFLNSNECSEHDSVKPSDGKNCASTSASWWNSPNEQGESTSDPNHETQNKDVHSYYKPITQSSSHANDLTKNNVSVPEVLSGKISSDYFEKDIVLPKVSIRPKERNYGTMSSVSSSDNSCKYQEDSFKPKNGVKNNQSTLGSRTESSESSVIIDHHSPGSSCDSQTIPYNSQDTSMLYGIRNCVNQGDFSIRQNPPNIVTAVNGRIRHRSGSWTGVNESDEDLQQLSRHNGMENIANNSQSLEDSHIFRSQGRNHVNSYQDSFNSFSSENTVPNCNEYLNEESIKRRLKFFFMNPIDKYRARKKCPWKLLVQIVKVIICTMQLCMFAIQRYNHVSYLWDTKVSLSHLFIQGWDSSREIVSYPPSTGPLAVYDIQQFYDFIDFSVNSFAHIEETAVGAYKYQIDDGNITMPEFCITSYKNGADNSNKSKSKLRNSILTQCFKIPTSIFNSSEEFSLKKLLSSKNKSINFDLLLESSYSFNLQTVKMKSEYPFETPECFQLETLIYFDNNDHDGQMLIDLDIVAKVLDCEDNITKATESKPGVNPVRTVVNVMTLLVCSVSFVLCFRALYRAQFLRSAVNSCFLYRFKRPLNKWESFEFVNLWYILICVLILTIKHCIPNITRYSICTLMVFAGYAFCGWLVLGPYHIKFRSLSTTSECLFSLINGDDMFATFTSTIGKDAIVWWFSRIYLYTFISLFIYVILSLKYYTEGFPETDLMRYAAESKADLSNGDFHDTDDCLSDVIKYLCYCCRSNHRCRQASGYERVPSSSNP
ncbi:Mucolipin-3 [Armadillidium vulgare]|nr:Mucolipin-3 [Armadillidium vulgare]